MPISHCGKKQNTHSSQPRIQNDRTEHSDNQHSHVSDHRTRCCFDSWIDSHVTTKQVNETHTLHSIHIAIYLGSRQHSLWLCSPLLEYAARRQTPWASPDRCPAPLFWPRYHTNPGETQSPTALLPLWSCVTQINHLLQADWATISEH